MFSRPHSPPCRAILVSQWHLALGKPLEYYVYLFMKGCHLFWFIAAAEADLVISLGNSWRGTDTPIKEFSFDKCRELDRIFRRFLNSWFKQMPNYLPACLLVVA